MKKERKRIPIYVDQAFLDSLNQYEKTFKDKPVDVLKRILKEYEKLKKEKTEREKKAT
tara:strand:+ start:52 stop:225 length:174 start_codon:yes stop_codon:yes gene_type:complete